MFPCSQRIVLHATRLFQRVKHGCFLGGIWIHSFQIISGMPSILSGKLRDKRILRKRLSGEVIDLKPEKYLKKSLTFTVLQE